MFVRSRERSGHAREGPLQQAEKANRFKRAIAPAGGDAVVGIVLTAVVRGVRRGLQQNAKRL